MSRLFAAILALLVLATALGVSGVAHAQGETTPKIGLRPLDYDGPYYDLQLNPGDEQELKIEIGNYGDGATKLVTYAANVYTAPNGGFSPGPLDEEPIGPTTWLDYDTETYELEGEQAIIRTFTVDVPEDVEPGEYITSVIVQNSDPIKGTGAVALDQILRVALAILITVPGDLKPDLRIGEARVQDIGDATIFMIDLENVGNERAKPQVEFVLRDSQGSELYRTSVAMDSVYAHSKTVVQVVVPQSFSVGDYTISLKLEDQDRGVDIENGGIPLSIAPPATPEPVVEVPPLLIEEFATTEARDSSTGALQVVEVVVRINNPGEPVADGRLTLHVEQDGQVVEDLVLGSALNFPGGVSEFRQRYLPIQGWQPGTYTFTIILDTVDPNSGDVLPVANAVAETVVTVE